MSAERLVKASNLLLCGRYSLLTSHALIDRETGRQLAQAEPIDCDKQISEEFEWLSYVLILI